MRATAARRRRSARSKDKPPPAWVTRYVSIGGTEEAHGEPIGGGGGGATADGREAIQAQVRGHLKRVRHGPGAGLAKWIWVVGYEARRWVAPAPRRVVLGKRGE